MTDAEVALATALIVILIFIVALFAQNRRPAISPPSPTSPSRPAPAGAAVPPGHPMDADRLSEQITAFEGRFDGRLTAMELKQAKTDHDVGNIRAALAALPSKDAVHRLEVQVTKTDGRVETIEAVLTAATRSLERIEGFLMSGGGRAP